MKVTNIFLVIFVLFTGLVACSSTNLSDLISSISGGSMKSTEDVSKLLDSEKMKEYLEKKKIDVDKLLKDPEEIKAMLPRLMDIESESFGVALAMLASGLFIAYMGIRLFKPFLAISGTIVGGGTFFFVYQKIIVMFPNYVPAEWLPWAVIAVGGLLGSTLFLKAWNLGTYVLCAYGGGMLAILVKGMTVQYDFSAKIDQTFLIVVFGALGLFFAKFIRDATIICTSALTGSFLIFLGLDNLKTVGFRKFVKDAIANNGQNISSEAFKGELAYCLVGVVFVTVTGIYIQFQNRPKNKKELD